MTVNQAYESGVRQIRQYPWNEFAHIDLPPMKDGLHGPWAVLVDPCCGTNKGIKVMLLGIPGGINPNIEEFEPWVKPERYEELFGAELSWQDQWR
jgi:hypothetical protein